MTLLLSATKSRLLLFRSRYCFLALVSFSSLSLGVLNGHLTEAHRLNHSIGPGTAQFNGHLVPFSLSQLHTRLDAMNGESREGILKNFETSWYIKVFMRKHIRRETFIRGGQDKTRHILLSFPMHLHTYNEKCWQRFHAFF